MIPGRKLLTLSIFALQRDDIQKCNNLLNDAHARFETILPEISGSNSQLFEKELSGAIQELVEAIAFRTYLETRTLVNRETVQSEIPCVLSDANYILGILDFTGELMRYTISNITKHKGNRRSVAQVNPEALANCKFMQVLYDSFELFGGVFSKIHSYSNKMEVFRSSLGKVEQEIYGVYLR